MSTVRRAQTVIPKESFRVNEPYVLVLLHARTDHLLPGSLFGSLVFISRLVEIPFLAPDCLNEYQWRIRMGFTDDVHKLVEPLTDFLGRRIGKLVEDKASASVSARACAKLS